MKPMSVGIIGTGRFASVLKALFRRDPLWIVKQSSRTKPVDGKYIFHPREVLACDIVIPAVPISALKEVLDGFAIDSLQHHPLVIGVCSVMQQPEKWMQEILSKEVDVLVTHPVFGPNSTNEGKHFAGLPLVWNPVRIHNTARLERLQHFLEKQQLQLLSLTSQEHDQIMSQTQFISFLFGHVGLELGLQSTQLDTAGFGHLLENQKIVETDSRQLFVDLCFHNGESQKQLQRIRDFLLSFRQEIWTQEKAPKLDLLRERIDTLDSEILVLLSERQRAVQQVGEVKHQQGIQPLQPQRWQKVLDTRLQQAQEFGLSTTMVKDLWERIHQEALLIEEGAGEIRYTVEKEQV